MNYEKKYKDALMWIESIYPTLSSEQRMEAGGVFPEIAERADERIRKVLIGWINLEPSISFGDSFDGFSKEQIIAWLEKQGLQNLANSAKTCKKKNEE